MLTLVIDLSGHSDTFESVKPLLYPLQREGALAFIIPSKSERDEDVVHDLERSLYQALSTSRFGEWQVVFLIKLEPDTADHLKTRSFFAQPLQSTIQPLLQRVKEKWNWEAKREFVICLDELERDIDHIPQKAQARRIWQLERYGYFKGVEDHETFVTERELDQVSNRWPGEALQEIELNGLNTGAGLAALEETGPEGELKRLIETGCNKAVDAFEELIQQKETASFAEIYQKAVNRLRDNLKHCQENDLPFFLKGQENPIKKLLEKTLYACAGLPSGSEMLSRCTWIRVPWRRQTIGRIQSQASPLMQLSYLLIFLIEHGGSIYQSPESISHPTVKRVDFWLLSELTIDSQTFQRVFARYVQALDQEAKRIKKALEEVKVKVERLDPVACTCSDSETFPLDTDGWPDRIASHRQWREWKIRLTSQLDERRTNAEEVYRECRDQIFLQSGSTRTNLRISLKDEIVTTEEEITRQQKELQEQDNQVIDHSWPDTIQKTDAKITAFISCLPSPKIQVAVYLFSTILFLFPYLISLDFQGNWSRLLSMRMLTYPVYVCAGAAFLTILGHSRLKSAIKKLYDLAKARAHQTAEDMANRLTKNNLYLSVLCRLGVWQNNRFILNQKENEEILNKHYLQYHSWKLEWHLGFARQHAGELTESDQHTAFAIEKIDSPEIINQVYAPATFAEERGYLAKIGANSPAEHEHQSSLLIGLQEIRLEPDPAYNQDV